MLQIEIDTTPVLQLIKKLSKSRSDFERNVTDRFQKLQSHLYNRLIYLTPVDTGYMQSQWKKQKIIMKKNSHGCTWIGKISNDTYYLYFVNYGHRTRSRSFVNGRYFVERAINSIKLNTKEVLKS